MGLLIEFYLPLLILREELLWFCFEPDYSLIYSFAIAPFVQASSLKGSKNEAENESEEEATDATIKISSVKSYKNLGNPVERSRIKQENKNKAGIYLFTNQTNGNIYVGSSSNLSSRFASYFRRTLTRTDLVIIRAIIKHGLDNFTLDVLEYTGSENNSFILAREQYYLDLLKPAYNMLKIAGSPKGTKWSEERLAKATDGRRKGVNSPWFGQKHSAESLAIMRLKATGVKMSAETIAKRTLNNPRVLPVYCYLKNNSDLVGLKPSLTNKDLIFFKRFETRLEAAKYINGSTNGIKAALLKGRFYKNKYYFTTKLLDLK